MIRPARWAALWMAAGMLGCAEPQIVYPGTAAYDRRVATFAVSPEAAEAAARQSPGWKKIRTLHDGPAAVIDREYLFGDAYKYARIDLTGVYVDGDTGAVTDRQSDLHLSSGWADFFYPHGMPTRVPDTDAK